MWAQGKNRRNVLMKTDFLGMNLKNPIIVSAGPWARDGESIKKLIEAGAGAVVTESIVSDAILDVCPRIAYNGSGVQNIRLYSDIQIEGWEHEMKVAKSAGGVVIASVSANTPSEAAYLAAKLEKFGADAIEVSVSNPAFEALEVAASHKDVVYDFTKAVSSSVKIPVIVKLSQTAVNIIEIAKAAKRGGAAAVSCINTIRCILSVDIESAMPALPTYGGYSGAPIRPISLAAVASIAQSMDIPISGIGGVEDHTHVIEYMMLGASVVQIGTAVMVNGPSIITKIVNDFEKWCEEKGITSVNQLRGKALKNLKSFEEMKISAAVCKKENTPCADGCTKCVTACMYNVLTKDGNDIKVDENRCTGCGLCVSLCPAGKLNLDL